MENDTSDITFESLFLKAKENGDEASLNKLLSYPATIKLLHERAIWASSEFKVDADEIQDHLTDKLRKKIRKIQNLKSWLFSVAINFCKNKYRHRRVTEKYNDRIAHENSRGFRRSATGQPIPLPAPRGDSPEEILIEKEEAERRSLQEADLLADLRHRIRATFVSLPPPDRKIAFLWACKGMTIKEISEVTGRHLSTVGRRLKDNVQKEIFKNIGIEEFLIDAERRRAALQLLASTLREIARERGFHA